jgi:hypothetical protein
MQRLTHHTAIWFAATVFCLVLIASAASAATPAPAPKTDPSKTGQALEIAPPIVYVTVDPGQTVKTQIYLRDISSGNLLVTGQANDFVASGEDGVPKLLLTANDEKNNPFSLKDWFGTLPSLTLIPHEIKTMAITLHIPANASPGGHYGVIRFTATPPELKDTGVSLSASLGALMLVTVRGDIHESLATKSFSVNNGGGAGSLFESGPVNFVEELNNTGNVHLQPTGQVSITDMFGKKLADVNVNLPPANILPQSTRKFTQPLDKSVIGNKMLFGRYTAKLKVTYGTDKKILTASLSFWVIPYRLIAILIIVLIAGFFILRYLVKRYNRYVISQANKSRRRR